MKAKLRKFPPSLLVPIIIALLCLILPLFLDLDYMSMNPKLRLSPPNQDMLLGADEYGRDLLARLVYGGRLSLGIAGSVTLITCAAGVLIGLYAAYFPFADKILMRVMDAFMSIPAILTALALMAVFSASAKNVIIALVIVYTPGVARLVRASALKIKDEEYIKALKMAGQSEEGIIFKHILPNVTAPLSVQATQIFADAIISEAALSFLGAGIPAREASWGNIIASGKLLVLKAPRVIILPSAIIFILLWSLIKTADTMRERNKLRRSLKPHKALEESAAEGRNCSKAKADGADDIPADTLLALRDFSLYFPSVLEGDDNFQALKNVSFDLKKGEVLALAGESGSGKSSVCQSIMRLYDDDQAIMHGSIFFAGRDLQKLSEKEMNKIRGKKIAMVFQDPHSALDPVRKIKKDFYELVAASPDRDEEIKAYLQKAGISDTERILDSYPHELSGGLKQRVVIAMALAMQPEILLLDEPTTALDVSVQKELMEVFADLKADGLSMIFVTHDLSLLKGFADRIILMRKGVTEAAITVEEFFDKPKNDYAQMLLAAIQPLEARKRESREIKDQEILKVSDLSKDFVLRSDSQAANSNKKSEAGSYTASVIDLLFDRRRLQAVKEISFAVNEGECLALVGESGSGKSTAAAVIAGVLEPAGGEIYYEGDNLFELPPEKRREIQMIFQNTGRFFDPRLTIEEALIEREKIKGLKPERKRREKLLAKVAMQVSDLDKRPFEFSGGQLRRLAIAAALLAEPEFLILDESLSGLDLPLQAEIIKLLKRLQKEEKLTYLLISHDLRAVAALADKVAVMKDGELLELKSAEEFFAGPEAEYSRKLLAAVPEI